MPGLHAGASLAWIPADRVRIRLLQRRIYRLQLLLGKVQVMWCGIGRGCGCSAQGLLKRAAPSFAGELDVRPSSAIVVPAPPPAYGAPVLDDEVPRVLVEGISVLDSNSFPWAGAPGVSGESHHWFPITSDNDDACEHRFLP